MAKAAALQVLTANRLRDGEVVYWRSGAWVGAFPDAEIFADEAQAKRALEAAARSVAERVVVNPYLFAVRAEADGLHPVEERERIRAAGPTIRRDLGKQAVHVPL
jgi:hypothetical protein